FNQYFLPATIAGDYDSNGIVDARDYTIWRDTFGSTTDLRANGDNTGLSQNKIDAADFAIWKSNFGIGQPGAGGGLGGGTVPEPGSIVLALVGVVGLLGFRRRAA